MTPRTIALVVLVGTVDNVGNVDTVVAAEPQLTIIVDTDMGGDCDDVGAPYKLHGAVERGEAKLLATMGCVSSKCIASAFDAINIWFGRPEISVGTLKDPGNTFATTTATFNTRQMTKATP